MLINLCLFKGALSRQSTLFTAHFLHSYFSWRTNLLSPASFHCSLTWWQWCALTNDCSSDWANHSRRSVSMPHVRVHVYFVAVGVLFSMVSPINRNQEPDIRTSSWPLLVKRGFIHQFCSLIRWLGRSLLLFLCKPLVNLDQQCCACWPRPPEICWDDPNFSRKFWTLGLKHSNFPCMYSRQLLFDISHLDLGVVTKEQSPIKAVLSARSTSGLQLTVIFLIHRFVFMPENNEKWPPGFPRVQGDVLKCKVEKQELENVWHFC